jgi:hypothetical protein
MGVAMSVEAVVVNSSAIEGDSRLERLEALGFKSELEYAEHQDVMAKSKALGLEKLDTVFSLPSTFVEEGAFYGLVVDVSDGFVTQKVNRSGDTVKHRETNLSTLVSIRDIVDIKYQGGVGMVSGKDTQKVER